MQSQKFKCLHTNIKILPAPYLRFGHNKTSVRIFCCKCLEFLKFPQGDAAPMKSTIDALDESTEKNSIRIYVSLLNNLSSKTALISQENKKSFSKVDCAVFDEENYTGALFHWE